MDKNKQKDKCKVNMHMKRCSTLLPITECKLKLPWDTTTHLRMAKIKSTDNNVLGLTVHWNSEIHIYLVPQNVILLRKRVSADAVNENTVIRIRIGLKFNDWSPYKTMWTYTEWIYTQRKTAISRQAETGVMQPQHEEHQDCWQLPEDRTDTWSVFSLRARPCYHLDF